MRVSKEAPAHECGCAFVTSVRRAREANAGQCRWAAPGGPWGVHIQKWPPYWHSRRPPLSHFVCCSHTACVVVFPFVYLISRFRSVLAQPSSALQSALQCCRAITMDGEEDLDRLEALALAGGGVSSEEPAAALAGDGGGSMPLAADDPSTAEDDLAMLESLGAAVPAPSGGFGDGGDDLAKVESLGHRRQPALKRKFAQRSVEAAAHARAGKAAKRQRNIDTQMAAAMHDKDSELALVAENFPGVVRACGINPERVPRQKAGAEISEDKAVALIRAAFALQRVQRGLGVTHERLVCFAADLCLTLQREALQEFLHKAALFRLSSTGAVAHVVILAYSHESDSTAQSVAQHVLQTLGRPSRRRLPTEVVNQRGSFRFLLRRVCKDTGAVLDAVCGSEAWHAKSVCVLEKASGYIAAALMRGMPFDLGDELWDKWSAAVSVACDAFLVDQRTDKGSNNGPALRHVAAVVGEVPAALLDMGVCELHVLNGLKSTIPLAQFDIGKMFALANVTKVGSHYYALTNSIAHLCHSTVQRLVQPPPPEAANLGLLLDALFDLEASRHQRRSRESFLLSDLRALADMPLLDAPGQGMMHQARVHFCWDARTGRPCCNSDEEAAEKATLAHIIFSPAQRLKM